MDACVRCQNGGLAWSTSCLGDGHNCPTGSVVHVLRV